MTGVNCLDNLELPARARNFQPPKRPAYTELPASDDFDQAGRANSLVSLEPSRILARTFRPPEPSAHPDLSAPGRQPSPTRANSLVRPDPPRNLARNLRRLELPASPGTFGPACAQRLGPRPVYPFAP